MGLFRLAAYEDLRHLLKHKRRYAPESLTASEKRILAKKSLPTRIWMATGKRVYYWITRGIFNFTDREGGGPRLVNDAPVLAVAADRASLACAMSRSSPFPTAAPAPGFMPLSRARIRTKTPSPIICPACPAKPRRNGCRSWRALPRAHDGAVRTDILHACGDEPDRSDRSADRERSGEGTGRPHRRRTAESARPFLRSRTSDPVVRADCARRATGSIAGAIADSGVSHSSRSHAMSAAPEQAAETPRWISRRRRQCRAHRREMPVGKIAEVLELRPGRRGFHASAARSRRGGSIVVELAIAAAGQNPRGQGKDAAMRLVSAHCSNSPIVSTGLR